MSKKPRSAFLWVLLLLGAVPRAAESCPDGQRPVRPIAGGYELDAADLDYLEAASSPELAACPSAHHAVAAPPGGLRCVDDVTGLADGPTWVLAEKALPFVVVSEAGEPGRYCAQPVNRIREVGQNSGGHPVGMFSTYDARGHLVRRRSYSAAGQLERITDYGDGGKVLLDGSLTHGVPDGRWYTEWSGKLLEGFYDNGVLVSGQDVAAKVIGWDRP